MSREQQHYLLQLSPPADNLSLDIILSQMELTLLSESWWRSGLFWWGIRSTDGRRGNSSSQLHRSPCFQTEHRVRPARAEKGWLLGTKVIKRQELMIMTAWKSGNDWNRNKNGNYTETNSPKKKKKQYLVLFRCDWWNLLSVWHPVKHGCV